jgi:hypothetical protein
VCKFRVDLCSEKQHVKKLAAVGVTSHTRVTVTVTVAAESRVTVRVGRVTAWARARPGQPGRPLSHGGCGSSVNVTVLPVPGRDSGWQPRPGVPRCVHGHPVTVCRCATTWQCVRGWMGPCLGGPGGWVGSGVGIGSEQVGATLLAGPPAGCKCKRAGLGQRRPSIKKSH